MNIRLSPAAIGGCVDIPSSKSQAHRLMICAALSKDPVFLQVQGVSQDMQATADCLRALGADIEFCADAMQIHPLGPQKSGELFCRESGSTLRFLLPLCGALGVDAVFMREGRLSERPLAPLDSELIAHGMRISADGNLLHVRGKLQSGNYNLPGNISSQYITGLLFALPLLDGESTLAITGNIESADYIAMTEDTLHAAGIVFEKIGNVYHIEGNQTYSLQGTFLVEGDWSSASFFLCAGALSEAGVRVRGLRMDSHQPDRAVLDVLARFGAIISFADDAITVKKGTLRACTIDAAQIPDLVPILSVIAAVSHGTTEILNAARLRLKESDRLDAVYQMLTALGAKVEQLSDGLRITGKPVLTGGTAPTFSDHRIVMSAAIASLVCQNEVTICGCEAVKKSYPSFFEDFSRLKGAES